MPSGLQCSMHWFPPPVKYPSQMTLAVERDVKQQINLNKLKSFNLCFFVVSLTFKILFRLYLRNCKCMKLILGMAISWRMKCATPWCDIYLTLDLVIVTLSLKILPGLSLRNYFVGEVDAGILV